MAILGYAYTEHLVSTVRAKLAARLNDAGNCFWSAEELDFYLQEAVDTWGLYARFFACRATVNVPAGGMEVNLSSLLTTAAAGGTESPLAFTVSGQQLLRSTLYHLMEPRALPTSSTFNSSLLTGQFSASLLNAYIPLAINQFIQETFCFVFQRQWPATALVASGEYKYALSQYYNNLVRVEHTSLEDDIRVLRRISHEQAKYVKSSLWNAQSRPEFYALETSSALSIYLLPWPNDSGKLTFYTIEHDPSIVDLFTNNQSWSMPYEFWAGVKFLALAKLCSTDGPTRYPQMAEYCLARYQQYVELARDYSALNDCWVEESLATFSPLSTFDNLYPGWRNKAALATLSSATISPRKEIGIMSPNKIFIRQKVDRDISLSFDISRNAPTLVATDYFPVGEDYLGYILDYAEHLALMKCGGAEFNESIALYKNFLYGAGRVNDKLNASLAKLESPAKEKYRQGQRIAESDRKEAEFANGR